MACPATATLNVIIDIGPHTLDVNVYPDTDFDSRFAAWCNDTGEVLFVNGWLAENIERIAA